MRPSPKTYRQLPESSSLLFGTFLQVSDPVDQLMAKAVIEPVVLCLINRPNCLNQNFHYLQELKERHLGLIYLNFHLSEVPNPDYQHHHDLEQPLELLEFETPDCRLG